MDRMWSQEQLASLERQKLTGEFTQACAQALVAVGGEAKDSLLTPSKRPDLADYQLNQAFALAKKLKTAPNAIAQRLAEELSVRLGDKASAEAAGGFVNVRLSDAWLIETAIARGAQGAFGTVVGVKAIIDYSSPNCAKRMHAGHLRSTVIGDAIARLLEKSGAAVDRVNHLGDWGTPFGVIIEQAADEGVDLAAVPLGQMEALYKKGAERFKSEPDFALRSRQCTAALQDSKEPQASHWRTIREKTLDDIQGIYDALGVSLTRADAIGESFYQPMLAGVIEELAGDGLVRESDGAIAFFRDGDENAAPLLLAKSAEAGGGYLYGATDAVALKTRSASHGMLLYVVDARQSEHFAALFELGERAGWLGESAKAAHLPFGVMLGSDGKPFKTRSGESFPLSSLIEEAVARGVAIAREKAPDAPEEALAELGRKTGIGALKYGDLSRSRESAVKFSLEEFVSLDGNTAPYAQYARVRALSILKNARGAEVDPVGAAFSHPAERQLAFEIAKMRDGAIDALVAFEPHQLCERIYALAQAMNAFYAHCPVLDPETGRASGLRLALCEGVAALIEQGLGALGIESPNEMPKAAAKRVANP
jgi:arginyl-tRNA synthetase